MTYAPASYLIKQKLSFQIENENENNVNDILGNYDLKELSLPFELFSSLTTSIKELNYDEIELGQVIGVGSFGTVLKGKWRDMNIAIKCLKTMKTNLVPGLIEHENFDLTDIEEFQREIETMSRVCNHMFIIQLIGVVKVPVLCVVTAFYENGSLEDLLVLDKKGLKNSIDTTTLIRFALETAIGIRHLHLEGIVHRDLAARNLLVDSNFHIRVSDFGFSRMKERGASKGYTQSSLGPIRWSSPEAMRKKKFSESSDVFSYGVVLYEIFVQEPPWKDMETIDVVIAVCGGERMSIPNVTKLPPSIVHLMSTCWSQDPDSRPPLPSIISILRELQDSISPHIPPSPISSPTQPIPTITTTPTTLATNINSNTTPISIVRPGSASPSSLLLSSSIVTNTQLQPQSQNQNQNFLSSNSRSPNVSNEGNTLNQSNSQSQTQTQSNSSSSGISALTSLLAITASRPVHRDLSLEIVTEPFQQTWEEFHDCDEEVLPPHLQRDTSSSLLSDVEFLNLVEQNRLHSWGHETSLRVMYLMLQENHRSNETVERIIQRFKSIQKDGFHMTIVYFWIQVIF